MIQELLFILNEDFIWHTYRMNLLSQLIRSDKKLTMEAK